MHIKILPAGAHHGLVTSARWTPPRPRAGPPRVDDSDDDRRADKDDEAQEGERPSGLSPLQDETEEIRRIAVTERTLGTGAAPHVDASLGSTIDLRV